MSRLAVITGAILVAVLVLHYAAEAQPMSPSKYYHMGPRLGKRNPDYYRIPSFDRDQVEAFMEGLQRMIAANGEGKGAISRMRPEFAEESALSQES